MKIKFQHFILLSLLLGSCTQEYSSSNPIVQSKKAEVELQDTIIEYPITIKHYNLKVNPVESGIYTAEYDSLKITILNDSSYLYSYYQKGSRIRSPKDTLLIPKKTYTIPYMLDKHDSLKLISSPIYNSPRIDSSLLLIEIEGKTYKIIEERFSCCRIWRPMGHLHFGSISYFSMDFGFLGSIGIDENGSSKTLWTGDWDQDIVEKLVSVLLHFNDEM